MSPSQKKKNGTKESYVLVASVIQYKKLIEETYAKMNWCKHAHQSQLGHKWSWYIKFAQSYHISGLPLSLPTSGG